jgi:AAA domain
MVERIWDADPHLLCEGARLEAAAAAKQAKPNDIELFDAADILAETMEPRGWLLGTTFCKQFTSSLVGTGGVGKTAVRIVQGLAVATGRNLTGEHVHKRGRVLFLCFEDGIAELKRRAQAAMRHHNVTADEVRGWMFFATISRHKILESGVRGDRVPGTLGDWLRNTIKKVGAKLVLAESEANWLIGPSFFKKARETME